MTNPYISLLILGCIGAVSCLALAIVAKPLNLGLIGNLVTGMISALVSVMLVGKYMGIDDGILVWAAILPPMAVMALIGLYLNHRAR